MGIDYRFESRPKRQHPDWLKVRAPFGEGVHQLRRLMKDLDLNTVCQEAQCPNMGECWSHGVATFMILGDICTRGCRYCAVNKGQPTSLDSEEPINVARAVQKMGLRHVVVTSVDRDDLADGGASVFVATVRAIRDALPDCKVELLIPDFRGDQAVLRTVMEVRPDVIGHNIETVPRLYPSARGGGDYLRSLAVLRQLGSNEFNVRTKTGMMFGLGESDEEIRLVLQDLLSCGVEMLTLGQYLRPSGWHLSVDRHYHPDEFQRWKEIGEGMGFTHVEAGPLVRSSYLADIQFEATQGRS